VKDKDIIATWVAASPPDQIPFRQCVHTLLQAIARDPYLKSRMILKGGILMAVRYSSPRFTTDVDFSSRDSLADVRPEDVRAALSASLATTVVDLPYGLDCRVQGIRVQPSDSPECRFPNIEVKVAYAHFGSAGHKRLLQGQGTRVLNIDFNLNEPVIAIEEVGIDGAALSAYALTDLISEKFRSLLQQAIRKRNRRQDIFDIGRLIDAPFTAVQMDRILQSLRRKARSRDVEPLPTSFGDPELERRARKEYGTLADEIPGELPEFGPLFEKVRSFHESLPWDRSPD
jgi:predicted nucleotidyltransferase component of viral defense system